MRDKVSWPPRPPLPLCANSLATLTKTPLKDRYRCRLGPGARLALDARPGAVRAPFRRLPAIMTPLHLE